jgi:trans-2,3-dihydro-3-hydroxyanthranilate isomerase
VVRAEAAARLRLGPLNGLGAHRLTWLDVFTATPLTGNGLAVVHDADALSEDVMHAFARETKLSETSFIQSAEAPGADYRHRIWMTTGEIPFAGHPSLGAAAAVACARRERRATYVQQTRPGLQPIEVESDGRVARVSMLQEPAAFGDELDGADVLPMLGLEPADADPALPSQVVSTGVPQIVVPVRADAVARVRPDYDSIGALIARHRAIVVYVAAVDARAGAAHARGFAATAAQGEDPATGSAAGPLCALVARHAGVARLDIRQGIEIGRPSRLRAEIDGDRVRVGGDVVVVLEGTLHLDA